MVAHGLENILNPLLTQSMASISSSANLGSQSWWSQGQKNLSDGWRGTNGQPVRAVPGERVMSKGFTNTAGVVGYAAAEIVKRRRELRENISDKTGAYLSPTLWTTTLWPLLDKILAKISCETDLSYLSCVDFLDSEPFPLSQVQTAAMAADALSACLQAALREDYLGFAIHHLPAVLYSLLALRIALEDHADLTRRCRLAFPYRRRRTVAAFPNSRGQGAAGSTSGSSTSFAESCSSTGVSLLAVLNSKVELALRKLVVTYADMLPTYSFPPLYAKALGEILDGH